MTLTLSDAANELLLRRFAEVWRQRRVRRRSDVMSLKAISASRRNKPPQSTD